MFDCNIQMFGNTAACRHLLNIAFRSAITVNQILRMLSSEFFDETTLVPNFAVIINISLFKKVFSDFFNLFILGIEKGNEGGSCLKVFLQDKILYR